MDGKSSSLQGHTHSAPHPPKKSQFYSDQVLTAAKRSLVMSEAQTRNSKWFLLCVKSNKLVVVAYRPVLGRILSCIPSSSLDQ